MHWSVVIISVILGDQHKHESNAYSYQRAEEEAHVSIREFRNIKEIEADEIKADHGEE